MGVNPREREDFDRILEKILETLPDYVRELLDQVPLIVDDEPSDEILRAMGLPNDGESDLCGLHWGLPLDQRSTADTRQDVDRIFVFRGPVLRLAGREKKETQRQIRITLLHEIGHHFGFDEKELEEMGYG